LEKEKMTVEKITIIAATKLATDPRTIQSFAVGDEIEVTPDTQDVVKRLLELRVAIPVSAKKEGKAAPEKNTAVIGTKKPVEISDDGKPADDADADAGDEDEGEDAEDSDEEDAAPAKKKDDKKAGNKKAGKK